jgi:protein-tyrosine phosphatase
MEYFDIHCHIVPGVDDGAKSLRESMKMLEMEYADGVRGIIVTPHYRRGMFETDDERVIEQFERLKEESAKTYPDLKLYLGCEFHAYTDMLEVFENHSRKAITMADSSYVLLEFSEEKSMHYIKGRTGQLIEEGYTPIIAHIERYPVVTRHPEFVRELVRCGARIQINAESLMGDMGWSVKHFCKSLMKERLVDFIGSDAHNIKTRRPNLGRAAAYVKRKYGEDAAARIFYENPMRILEEGEHDFQ